MEDELVVSKSMLGTFYTPRFVSVISGRFRGSESCLPIPHKRETPAPSPGTTPRSRESRLTNDCECRALSWHHSLNSIRVHLRAYT